MEKNYYEKIIEKIYKLIEEDKKNEVYQIAKEELSLPYVPKIYEDILINIIDKLYEKKEPKHQNYFSRDELLNIMFEHKKHNVDFIINIASSFDSYNWKGYEKEIEKIFNFEDVDKKAKSLIYNNLVIQDIDHNFKIEKHKLIINPKKNKTTFETLFAIKNLHLLSEKNSSNPSIFDICEKIFFIYIMNKFPESIFLKFEDISDEIIKISKVMIGEIQINELGKKEMEIYRVINGDQ